MLRWIQFAAFMMLLTSGTAPAVRAQATGGGLTKENLDLPYDAIGDAEEEEDAPEIVTFYGTNLEGDGFFYVIDRSSTMQDSGELSIAKREAIRNVTEFTEHVKFGIFFFDKSLVKFPGSGQAAEANPGMKSAGVNFIQSTPGGSGTCQIPALSAALLMANSCSSKRKVIVYLSDGGGTCNGADEAQYLQQALASTSAQNYNRIPINTIGVLTMPPLNEQFMRNLAATNGGTYTRINR